MPAMIGTSCTLFYNSNNLYMLWSTGKIKSDLYSTDIIHDTKWTDVTTTTVEDLFAIEIPTVNKIEHQKLLTRGYIQLEIPLILVLIFY